jgi:hypothetical protein
MTETSGVTYHLSKLLGQLVETVKRLRWCSSPLAERNIARRFSGSCCKTHDEMEEAVGERENEVWWDEKRPKINECCEEWMEVSK